LPETFVTGADPVQRRAVILHGEASVSASATAIGKTRCRRSRRRMREVRN